MSTKIFTKGDERVVVASDVFLSDWPEYTEEILTGDDAKAFRNKLLQESDWTQVPDAPVNKYEWRSYRQILRDMPSQDGFTAECTWPTKPE